MKNLILFILLTTLGVTVSAQMAIDFTVTDSDGTEHILYADYLNQDKTVVLKIFFTSCPPCRSIATDFQQLYEDWGSGSGDVQFIELSNKSFDNNMRVQNYKSEFSLTFPSAGVDGGSVAIANNYTDGRYGQFTGTPTFIVISPDGTVNYDVSGSGNAGTIAALNAAIEESREITPVEPLFRAAISDPQGQSLNEELTLFVEPIAGAPAQLVAQTFLLSPNDDGEYVLEEEDLEDANFYRARFSYGQNIPVRSGINTLDLLTIQRHILGILTFTSPLQEPAADANFDGAVNVLDLLKLQQIILDLEFSLGEENYIILNECNRLTQWFNFFDLPNSSCPAEFFTYKVGDMNQF